MKRVIAAIGIGFTLIAAGTVFAEPVATVVAIRGKATIERAGTTLEALTSMGIELQDTIATAEGGRAKLLFIDDSVLTLAEKSRMSVDTFIHSRSDRGKSFFNLMDGKLRAVVGKAVFEVKTPTVVAAARGTVILFETGEINGQAFTRVTSLEGIVEMRSLTLAPDTPPVMLAPGQSMLVMAGQPLPEPTTLTPEELAKLKSDGSSAGVEIQLPDTTFGETIIPDVEIKPIPVLPTFDRQQPVPPQPTIPQYLGA